MSTAAVFMDAESQRWVQALSGSGPDRDDAVARLHDRLLRGARAELHRRDRGPVTGLELDELAHEAANDAVVAVLRKLAEFRGDSRFTTWAYRFVILEVSSKLGRRFWRTPAVSMTAEDWDRLPDRFGFDPAEAAQWRDLVDALHRAVDEDLTGRQRHIFVALVLNGVPLDAVVSRLDTNRNAIYKTLFDARRKLRANLVANGYLAADSAGPPSAPGHDPGTA